MLLSLFGLVATAVIGQVEVSDTSTAMPYAAVVSGLTDETLKVVVKGQAREVPLAELRRIEFPGNPPIPSGKIGLTLRDGSTLNANSLVSDGVTSQLTLPGGGEVQVETKFLSNVRLADLSEAQQSQWEAICQSRISADMLVLIRSPESLDKIEGIINGIGSETIDFEFSGQKIPAPLAKLAGVRFFSNAEISSRKLAAIIRDTRGSLLNVARITSPDGDVFDCQLQCGLSLRLQQSEIAEVDFSVGSMKYVAGLEPLGRTSVNRFELGISIEGSQQMFGARVAKDPKLGPSVEFLGGGTATYRVPKDFTRLIGGVELNPPGGKLTPCFVQILLEKKVVWEKRLVESKQLAEIDVAVKGEQRVELVVKPESQIPVGDVVLFRELRFLK